MKRIIVGILATLLALSLPYNVSTTLVTISNVLSCVHIHGKPMNIHDGNVIQYEKGGLFYYYTMALAMARIVCHSTLGVLDSTCWVIVAFVRIIPLTCIHHPTYSDGHLCAISFHGTKGVH